MKLNLNALTGRNLCVSGEELLDAAVSTFVHIDSMVETTRCLDMINERLDMMGELRDTVKKYGYTQSLEALFGGNFECGYSNEGLGEKIASGWKTFVEWCKKLWQKIKDFFALFFNSSDKMITKLEEREKEVRQYGLKNENTKVTIPGATMIRQVAEVVNKNLASDLQNALKEIEQMKQSALKKIEQLPNVYDQFKPIIERYAQIGLGNLESGIDIVKGAGAEDDVTLTKSIALTYITMDLEILKALRAAKKYVDDLHKNINELLNTVGKAIATKQMGQEKGELATAVGNAIINSPTGREVIGAISKWCSGLLSKGTKFAIVFGSRILSMTTPAKGGSESKSEA